MIPFLWENKRTVIPMILAAILGMVLAFWPAPGHAAPAAPIHRMTWEINYKGQQYLVREVSQAPNSTFTGTVAGNKVRLVCSQETPTLNVCGLFIK